MEQGALQSSSKYLRGGKRRQKEKKEKLVLLLIKETGQYDLQPLDPSHLFTYLFWIGEIVVLIMVEK